MGNEFISQAENARDRYISVLRSTIANQHPQFAAELLVKPNGRTNGEPFCLARIDIIAGEPPNHSILECRDIPKDVSSIDYTGPHGIQIRQQSFSWNSLLFRFKSQTFDVELLKDWFEKWIDLNETNAPDEQGLHGVIHDLSWSKVNSDNWELLIDFGSAPLESI
ncbi:MAG: hypothetical protein R2684_13990 [Pyrinomonadaceae bacterium]